MNVKVLGEDLLPDLVGEAVVTAASVGDAAKEVGLAPRSGLVILVNGRLADWATALADGDVVEFMPVLGGG